jgi:hypothetical protein
VYVNTQVAGTTVTGARSHELPEQYLVPTWSTPYEPELLSRSSLTAGELLLHEDDARRLTELLVRIHGAMLPAGSSSNAMDVEFSMRADRSFVIVQARPYNIVYSGDRARREIDESAFERTMFRVRRVLGRVSELRRTRSSRSERT